MLLGPDNPSSVVEDTRRSRCLPATALAKAGGDLAGYCVITGATFVCLWPVLCVSSFMSLVAPPVLFLEYIRLQLML